jgi:hypothetical protein
VIGALVLSSIAVLNTRRDWLVACLILILLYAGWPRICVLIATRIASALGFRPLSKSASAIGGEPASIVGSASAFEPASIVGSAHVGEAISEAPGERGRAFEREGVIGSAIGYRRRGHQPGRHARVVTRPLAILEARPERTSDSNDESIIQAVTYARFALFRFFALLQ